VFQFPSNGKDFPNIVLYPIYPARFVGVSIPFKREGLSERTIDCMIFIEYSSFNSLQTGRTFRTKTHKNIDKKVIFKVSIPFKREGLSELKLMW